jgi:hypothetical protein
MSHYRTHKHKIGDDGGGNFETEQSYETMTFNMQKKKMN